jgi:hypothetical protein
LILRIVWIYMDLWAVIEKKSLIGMGARAHVGKLTQEVASRLPHWQKTATLAENG